MAIHEFNEGRTKFLEEGQRLAGFQHISIVKVFSLFEENNTAYMVMEFLKGKDLQKIVEERGPLPEKIVLDFIVQVANALDVVHRASVIHRDIKPANIMVAADNRAVLVDFGATRDFAAGKTRAMTRMWTDGYAPLEQYGDRAQFGVFTDIYALGATTYHLLTGAIPIQATDRAAGVELAAPQRKRGSINRRVSDAVMWAMEMQVDKRPQSVSEFIQALRGSRPRAPNRRTSGPKLPRRRMFVVLGLSIATLAPVAVLLLASRYGHEAGKLGIPPAPPGGGPTHAPTPPAPERPVPNPSGPNDVAEQGLASLNSREYRRAFDAFDRLIALKPREPAGYVGRGLASLGRKEYERAAADFTDAISADRRCFKAWYNRGVAWFHIGKFDAALADYNEAIRINADYTEAYYNRGVARLERGENDEAIHDFTDAIQREPKFLQAYINRGVARFRIHQMDLAVADYSEAIKINPRHPDAYRYRGVAWRRLGMVDRALADEAQAERLARK
jgi:tetratricopeptide (TPR) repeat protein